MSPAPHPFTTTSSSVSSVDSNLRVVSDADVAALSQDHSGEDEDNDNDNDSSGGGSADGCLLSALGRLASDSRRSAYSRVRYVCY